MALQRRRRAGKRRRLLAGVLKLVVVRCIAYRGNDLAAPAFIQQFREFAISVGQLLHSGDVHRKLRVGKYFSEECANW
jgi:hypothetical protein